MKSFSGLWLSFRSGLPLPACGRAAAGGSGQSARPERRSSLGAVVFKLPGRTEKRRLAQNGQSKSAGEILFCLGLERRRRWASDADEVRDRRQPNVTILADPGPRRRREDQAVCSICRCRWIPTTWIFKGGDLRYALNYGEVRFRLCSSNFWRTVTLSGRTRGTAGE